MIQRQVRKIWRPTPATPATTTTGAIHHGMSPDGLALGLAPTPVRRTDNVALTARGLAVHVADFRFWLRQAPE
jgi:hypothetical protein